MIPVFHHSHRVYPAPLFATGFHPRETNTFKEALAEAKRAIQFAKTRAAHLRLDIWYIENRDTAKRIADRMRDQIIQDILAPKNWPNSPFYASTAPHHEIQPEEITHPVLSSCALR